MAKTNSPIRSTKRNTPPKDSHSECVSKGQAEAHTTMVALALMTAASKTLQEEFQFTEEQITSFQQFLEVNTQIVLNKVK